MTTTNGSTGLVPALFARASVAGMAAGGAVVFALVLFLATAVLLIKGADPGVPIGPNLAAMSTFLPGYDVSWGGALVGAGFGLLFGALLGTAIAVLWNLTHLIIIGLVVLQATWFD
ncbi:MAG: hypothetical protein RIM84_26360 [Alphaproteobacteria bacterium]